MKFLFATTIFLGAALLFMVQPLFARLVLPYLGGSPAVWNTAMVFFQTALLVGYGYVHLTSQRLSLRRQVVAHLFILLLPALVLPVALPSGWTPPAQHNPIPWLLMLMSMTVGLPFVVVSATSPLLQRWFSASGHRDAADPYFLYAASNAGSLIGLLSYPLLLEPQLRLAQQSRLWTIGYAALVVMTAACAAVVWKGNHSVAEADASATVQGENGLTLSRRMRWLLLAFAPSSLMLSVTMHLSTDLAAVPLLWVIPLSVYLLSFVFVFARRPPLPHAWMARALPFAVLPLAVFFGAKATRPLLVVGGWHIATLFVAAMVCHGELAKDRPAARHLPEFYFWMSVGGVCGGIFNALIAPQVFHSVLEYPLTLALVCLLGARPAPRADERRQRLLDVLLPLALAVVAINIVPWVQTFGVASVTVVMGLKLILPATICYAFRTRPLRFGLGVAAVLLAGAWLPGERQRVLFADRSFFGLHRVMVDTEGEYHRLLHGSTVHGVQSLAPETRREPQGYYHHNGPIGQFFASRTSAQVPRRVALVGLGAGAMLAYAMPQQEWTIYEIDPVVERVARDTRLFTYLADSAAPYRVVLGDARLSLAARHEQYDLIVLDAYSSDSIPLHLTTREALRLYLDHLAPGGVLAFHISNRYLDLTSVVAGLAADANLFCLVQDERQLDVVWLGTGRHLSKWALMTREPEVLRDLEADSRWFRPAPRPNVGVWTDDYASIFQVFRWR